MSTLIDHAREHIASLVEGLTGEEDFMPFMTIRGRDNDQVVYAALEMPADNKDFVADAMMSLCAVHRAVEVVFVSTSWMVTLTDGSDLKVRPSQSPDRVEVVFMVEVNEDGDMTHTAAVTRENNTVSLGEWSSFPADFEMSGRFGTAIHMGMDLGRHLPPDMCSFIDAEFTAGRGQKIIGGLMQTVRDERRRMIAEVASRN